MKFLIFFLMLPFFVGAQENTSLHGNETWLSDYDSALETAKINDQNILIYFTGSDWCPPCKMLKKDFFDTSQFSVLSNNFVLLYIDIPRNRGSLTKLQLDHNIKLLSNFNKKGLFPLIKIISPQGESLDELSGYRMNGNIKPYVVLMEKYR